LPQAPQFAAVVSSTQAWLQQRPAAPAALTQLVPSDVLAQLVVRHTLPVPGSAAQEKPFGQSPDWHTALHSSPLHAAPGTHITPQPPQLSAPSKSTQADPQQAPIPPSAGRAHGQVPTAPPQLGTTQAPSTHVSPGF
jgi:hypothetical protein